MNRQKTPPATVERVTVRPDRGGSVTISAGQTREEALDNLDKKSSVTATKESNSDMTTGKASSEAKTDANA